MIKICTALGLIALAIGTGKGLIDEPKPPILDVPTEIVTEPSDKCEWLGVCDA